jgi:hypothetical protein
MDMFTNYFLIEYLINHPVWHSEIATSPRTGGRGLASHLTFNCNMPYSNPIRQQISFGRKRNAHGGCVLAKASGTLRFRLTKRQFIPPQRDVAVAHFVLQGKGPVRQRSLSADLIFCYFSIKRKVKGLRGPSGASL